MSSHNTWVLIAVILLQQGLIGLAGAAAAVTGLTRAPAWHWCAAALAGAASLVVSLLREQIDPWFGFVLANLLGIAGIVALRRGGQVFCGVPPSDREHLVTLGASAAALALLVLLKAPAFWFVTVTSLVIAVCLVRSAGATWHRLRFEFGVAIAWVLVVPQAVAAVLFGVRALLAPLLPGAMLTSASGAVHAGFVIVMLSTLMLLHVALGGMAVLRLVRQLRHLSWHDPLTGVLNRRGMEERIEREAQRLRRHGQPFALLSIDIDHFKRINDQHGHDCGDRVLQAVASNLGTGLREMDSLGRMGGEEFFVLLPHGDDAAALAAAARLTERLRALQAATAADGRAISVTASIGVAVAGDRRESRQELLRRLDAALYRAKDEGRDRVVLAEPALSALRLAAD